MLSGDPADTISAFTPSGTTFIAKTGFPVAANLGGITAPVGLYLDGAQSTWVTDGQQTSTSNFSLSAIGLDAVALSPSGKTNGGYQKSNMYFTGMRNIVIDSGGNIWITNDNIGNGVTEVVGGAVPIYQPYSFGITQNRFQTVP